MVIDFRKNADKLFTPVYYMVRAAKTRVVVLKGGAGSSKSYSVAQNELIKLMQTKEGDTLVLRKFGADLRESVYKLFNDLIDKYNLRPFFKSVYSNDNRRITYLPTGRSIIFKGVDDSEKLKSIVGIKRIILEEASQFDLTDFMEIMRRARGMEGIQVVLILNPISEKHWIKNQLCDADGPYRERVTEITVTYKNNPFLTQEDIDELEGIKKVSENQYRIYVLAEWGVEDKSNKFAYAFDSNKHVKPTKYNDEHLLWLSFDFNVNPISCTAFQWYDNKFRGIKCFKLDNSNIYELCQRIAVAFPGALFKVTGDASGNARTAMVHEGINYYSIIKDELHLLWTQFNVPAANPKIEENQLVVNAVLMNVDVELDPVECAPLIFDLTYVEIGQDKKIIKDRTSDKKKSDFLDHLRYQFNILFPDIAKLPKKAA